MQKTDNRTNGGRFEQELAKTLADSGFWVHVMQQNKAGQPADIIAIRGAYHTLIDCKVVSDDGGFPFSRIEENQKFAMRMFFRKAKELCYFAIRLPDDEIRMVTMERLETLKNRGKTRITDEELRTQTWPLEEWIKSSKNWAEET